MNNPKGNSKINLMLLKLLKKNFANSKGFINRCLCYLLKSLYKQCGHNVRFNSFDNFAFKSISIGNDVSIGPGANFSSSGAYLKIGEKVLFGPNVTIMTGDHNTRVVGKKIFDVSEKNSFDDQPVIIDEDVWVGACVLILKGVHIGRGSIIAAGSVVTKEVPPYCVVAGVPAKIVKVRWSINDIQRHEKILYSQSDRTDLSKIKEYHELYKR